MKTPKDGDTAGPSPGVTEEGSPGKRKARLERPAAGGNAASDIDGEALALEIKRLTEEVESLEEENRVLTRQAENLQESLAAKRAEAQGVFEKSDRTKKGLAGYLAKKRGLLNEIGFFEKEKSQLLKTQVGISERLQDNVSVLGRTTRDMDYLKGETQALMDKMGMLEGQVPVKYRDVDNLDERIRRTFQTLKGFYGRMRRMEKTVKETYYMSKKE